MYAGSQLKILRKEWQRGFKYSGMLRRVDWQTLIDASNNSTAFICSIHLEGLECDGKILELLLGKSIMRMGKHGGGRQSCPMAGFDTNTVEHKTGTCYFWATKTEWGPHIQGEHKIFPRLQTFITRKLRGIQTYNCNITINTWHKILEINLINSKKICLYCIV
jgi:hypothetical protein